MEWISLSKMRVHYFSDDNKNKISKFATGEEFFAVVAWSKALLFGNKALCEGWVLNLVLSVLQSNSITIEEFHHSLQDVTNFPLRPFVVPFLRAHLPLLQRELSNLARLAKQVSAAFAVLSVWERQLYYCYIVV